MDEAKFSPDVLMAALRRLPAARRYRVAYSGGVDSHALLHAFSVVRRELGAVLDALHVNHRLHPDADVWAAHCHRVCADLGLHLETLAVDVGTGRGEGPEAAARRARYGALAAALGPGDALCTAHHRDDQVETMLLRLVRGAGVRGLRAMRPQRPLGRGVLVRPLLDVAKSALEDYARACGLEAVSDPSNASLRYDRNYIRHRVLPVMRARWPGMDRTVVRAIAHQSEALVLLDALADADARRVGGPQSGTLSRARLRALGQERRQNCLRRWVEVRGLPPPSEAQMRRIQRDLVDRPGRRSACVSWPGAELRAYRDGLYALAPLPPHDAALRFAWRLSEPLDLPHGRLLARPARGRGLDGARTGREPVEVRFRRGGERCRPLGRAHSQRLKKLLQEHAVPPWQRDRIPLVYVGGELAVVAGLWVCAGFEAPAQRRGWEIRWEPAPGGASD